MTTFLKKLGCGLLLILLAGTEEAQATVKLPSVFSDNMVLQQKTAAAIWGKAKSGSSVTITASWTKVIFKAKADANGDWKIKIPTPSYGGPYELTFNDGALLKLKNVLIGDVWICSGQSNMEMPLAGWGSILNFKSEIAEAKYPNIRLLQGVKLTSNTPVDDAKVENGGWKECSPEYISNFSSTAYFFAREVYRRTKIPIGLIHTSWGGTIAEAWTSGASLKTMPDFTDAVNKIETAALEKNAVPYEQRLKQWMDLVKISDKGVENGQFTWAQPASTEGWKDAQLPGAWENSGYSTLDGIVWYTRQINIPADWTGETLTLNLGMIDDNETTWFNGTQVGETAGHTQVRKYTIPAGLVKAGLNTITIRVFDSGGGGGLYSDASALSITGNSGKSIPLAGVWKMNIGLDFKNIAPMPVADNNPNRPTVLYNAMIYPYIQFAIKGAIWYQGESNADRAHQYQRLFPTLIKDWRKQWGQGDFPFYFVQLANFMAPDAAPAGSSWAELREAQAKTLSLPNTGMAVTIDIGDEKDIHPKNKQEVGRRLALAALAKTYMVKTSFSGPVYKNMKIEGNKIMLDFNNSAGLEIKGNNGFAIAGNDQKFYWAKAVVKGNQLIISSEDVKQPVAVRYGWGNNPQGVLYNNTGLPASPFRTDNWKGITEK